MAPEVVRTLFGDRRAALAWGARHGRAKAVIVPGGYRVTGRWDFASGNRHCTCSARICRRSTGWHAAPVARGQAGGRDRAVPARPGAGHAGMEPLGLRGTGSDIYEVEDLFVPDSHACVRDRLRARRDHGPVTAITSHLCYATGFSATALGVARGLLNRYVTLARGKTARAGAQPMAENHCVQSEIAQLEAALRGCRMYLLGTVREAWAEAVAHGALAMETRVALRLATTTVMRQATDVSVACYRAGGTTAILESERLRAALPRRDERLPASAGDALAPGDGGALPAGQRREAGLRLTAGPARLALTAA